MALRILAQQGTVFAQVTHGIPLVELGINVSRFMVRYYPEVNETIPNHVGNTLWRVVSDRVSREVQCDGEINASAGVMLFTVANALVFANYTQNFQGTSGTFYLDEATVTYSRGGWLTVSVRASARASL